MKKYNKQKYNCDECPMLFNNIINFYNHSRKHYFKEIKEKYKNNYIVYKIIKNQENNDYISYKILKYLVDNYIEPSQYDFDGISNDVNVLFYFIKKSDCELICIDILELLNEKIFSYIHEIDDEEKLREYLLSINIIKNYNDNLEDLNYNFYKYEELCHYTNNSILMYCIKQKWNKFCLKLLDYPSLSRINKQNITNAYEMALKYELYDISNKILNIKNKN
jgi:hypothetical protein